MNKTQIRDAINSEVVTILTDTLLKLEGLSKHLGLPVAEIEHWLGLYGCVSYNIGVDSRKRIEAFSSGHHPWVGSIDFSLLRLEEAIEDMLALNDEDKLDEAIEEERLNMDALAKK